MRAAGPFDAVLSEQIVLYSTQWVNIYDTRLVVSIRLRGQSGDHGISQGYY